MKRLFPAVLALCAFVFPAAARAQDPDPSEQAGAEIDQGSFRIYQSDRLLGTEVFSLVSNGDSLLVTSRSFQVLPGPDTLRKTVAQVVGLLDYGLRTYRSKQQFAGHTLTRALNLADTSFTSLRQLDQGGDADWLALPPGRVFVMDPKSFICFDLICRSLQGKTFDHRPLTLFVLGARDSMLEVTAADLGLDTLRWGSRPVQARKLSIGDAHTTFTVWAAPRGHLLRLVETSSGLRVERDPPALKPRAPKPKPGG
jgi:hypothetical protein